MAHPTKYQDFIRGFAEACDVDLKRVKEEFNAIRDSCLEFIEYQKRSSKAQIDTLNKMRGDTEKLLQRRTSDPRLEFLTPQMPQGMHSVVHLVNTTLARNLKSLEYQLQAANMELTLISKIQEHLQTAITRQRELCASELAEEQKWIQGRIGALVGLVKRYQAEYQSHSKNEEKLNHSESSIKALKASADKNKLKKIEDLKSAEQHIKKNFNETSSRLADARNRYILELETINKLIKNYHSVSLPSFCEAALLGVAEELDWLVRTQLRNEEETWRRNQEFTSNLIEPLMGSTSMLFYPPENYDWKHRMQELKYRPCQLTRNKKVYKDKMDHALSKSDDLTKRFEDWLEQVDRDPYGACHPKRPTQKLIQLVEGGKQNSAEAFKIKADIVPGEYIRKLLSRPTEDFGRFSVKKAAEVDGLSSVKRVKDLEGVAEHAREKLIIDNFKRSPMVYSELSFSEAKSKILAKLPHNAASDSLGSQSKLFGGNLEEYCKVNSVYVPPIVDYCSDYLKKFGLQTEGIFRLAGKSQTIAELRDLFSSSPQCNPFVRDLSNDPTSPMGSKGDPTSPMGSKGDPTSPLGSKGDPAPQFGSKGDLTPPGGSKGGQSSPTHSRGRSAGSVSDFSDDVSLDIAPIYDPVSVGSVLKQYFNELDGRILTQEKLKQFSEALGTQDKEDRVDLVKEVFGSLPFERCNTLVKLLQLLSNVARNSHVNKMAARNLAICWTPSLTECDTPPDIGALSGYENYDIGCVEALIAICPDIFPEGKNMYDWSGEDLTDDVMDSPEPREPEDESFSEKQARLANVDLPNSIRRVGSLRYEPLPK